MTSKISFEALARFFNSRNQREKTMLVIFGICFVVTADVLLVVQPALNSFFKTQPELLALRAELKELEQDRKNEKQIEAQWKSLGGKLGGLSERFVTSSEISMEDLSKLAQESGVKISSLTPAEKSKNDAITGAYVQVPVKIRATAGIHALGSFLAKVETNGLFFRVTHLIIKENAMEVRNHQIEMNVECYRKI
ncbi:MAG: hypothetical protein A3C47_05760 [Omnitrophica bacterium RIFCSPHIGHO2_02_FULL_51_18]|nr:MAG: hypothetical protein A3C47_05760 [Omnitrophica bacterium RIFCSPHIGHO2_02_FULL_51_18]